MSDIRVREVIGLVPILGAILLIGIYPRPFLDRITPSVQLVRAHVETSTGTPLPAYANERAASAAEDPAGTVDAYGRRVVPPFASGAVLFGSAARDARGSP